MSMLKRLAAAAVLVAVASPAAASTVVGLSGENTLHRLDITTWTKGEAVTVTGVAGRLLGIDVRPSDGRLYGLFGDGTLAAIDPATGAATRVSTLKIMLADGVPAVVDFNPVADKLRVMGADGTSLRVTVETGDVVVDGRHSYADGRPANVIAGAYTNAFAGAEKTQLFNIDGSDGRLVLQDPPNEGKLNVIGELGVLPTVAAFDIASDGKGSNQAWLVADGRFHMVDLATGTPTLAGTIDGATMRDIAVMPAM